MDKARGKNSGTRRRPARSPEAREQQMISYAVDLAEQQLRDGTASSQIITHYLKEASMKHQIELEKLRLENELIRAKTESLEREQKTEEMFRDAIEAMKKYSGNGDPDDY